MTDPITNKKKNVLLLKDDVGRPRPPNYKLPDNNFRYGKPNIKEAEGAK